MMEKVNLNCFLEDPDVPDRNIATTLTFTAENGTQIQLSEDFRQEKDSYDILNGVDENHRKITLKNIKKMNDLQYRAKILFIGFNYQENVIFDYLKINFSFLEEWSEITEFEVDELPYSQSSQEEKIIKKFRYEFPNIKEAVINNNIKISLIPDINYNKITYKGLKLELKAYFKIESIENPVLYEDYDKIAEILQNFLTLALGNPIKINEMFGYLNNGNSKKKIKIFRTKKEVITRDYIHPLRMNFQLGDIKNDFNKILNNWFEMYENNLKPVLNQYFGILYSPFLYKEHKFLSLCQALEVYCRESCENFYVSNENFKNHDIYNDLCKYLDGNGGKMENLRDKYNLDEGFISHLKNGTFKYANEFSLRKKLATISNKYNEILNSLPFNILGKTDIIADLRNYFTHYTDELKQEVGSELKNTSKLALGLRQILEICLLSELNIPKDLIRQRINNRYEGFKFTFW